MSGYFCERPAVIGFFASVLQERCSGLNRVAMQAQAKAVIDESDPLLNRLKDLLASEQGGQPVPAV